MNKIINASVSVDNEFWKSNRVSRFGQCQVFSLEIPFTYPLNLNKIMTARPRPPQNSKREVIFFQMPGDPLPAVQSGERVRVENRSGPDHIYAVWCLTHFSRV